MTVRFSLLATALLVVAASACCTSSVAQTAAAPLPPAAPMLQPLDAMPYSPSLDLSDLDRSVDPCDDFYKFSCGGWQKNNPIPADQASWSVYGKLANENQQFLWGILRDVAVAKDRTPVQQKIGDYYAACMDTAAIDRKGFGPLKPELAQIDGLKTRAALIAAIPMIHHTYPGTYFFDSGTDQDAVDSNMMIAVVDAGGLSLPDRDYYLKTDAKSVELRQKYVDYVVKLMQMVGETEAQAKADADSVSRRRWPRRR
jgi:putative endopeptidase